MQRVLAGAVGELVAARFGGPCSVDDHFGVVTGTNQYVTSNLERVWVCFVNNSAVLGYLCPHEESGVTRGIPILPNGGMVVLDATVDAVLPAMAWFLNSYSGLATAIYVIEVFRLHADKPAGAP